MLEVDDERLEPRLVVVVDVLVAELVELLLFDYRMIYADDMPTLDHHDVEIALPH